MPGLQGQLYAVLANRGYLKDQQYAELIKTYGLDQPEYIRFLDYVKATLTFQFGYSYQSNRPVFSEMIESGRLVNTLLLLGSSTVISIVIGILLGILVARRRGSFFDSLSVTTSLTTYSLPTFFIGIVLILIFSFQLGWFPGTGTWPNTWSLLAKQPDFWTWTYISGRLAYLFLPALTLTLFTYGGFLLLTRATMLETLSEDYILTARAKGISERGILLHHAFKNASLPIITATALQFGFILSGAIITETVFSYSGLGKWLWDATLFKDFPVMQAMFYIIALSVIAANFISDVFYGIVDPRIRYE